MQARLKWLLVACAIVIVGGGVALLWSLHHAISASSFWKHHASTILQYAIPPVVALLGWTAQQVITSRPRQSTPKQVQKARKAVAGRGLEWWRGIPEPAWPGRVLRAGLAPLDVTWSGMAADGAAISGQTTDVAALAQRFRDGRPFRLVIRGASGSGKSVFARLLMAELLKHSGPGQPVPVFLPLWSWDVDKERMNDWMKRWIAENYPELGEQSVYGPTAVSSLVDQGLVLPVLDGLNALPRELRKTMLDDGWLTAQDRLILTCRTGDSDRFEGFAVIAPEDVNIDDATEFLGTVTDYPKDMWDAHKADADFAALCANPQLIYLTSAVSVRARYDPDTFCRKLAEVPGGGTAGDRLAGILIPAFMRERDRWERQYPAYGAEQATRWLSLLAPLGLREAEDLRATGSHGPRDTDPGMSCIAWWNLHRGVPRIDRHQATLRAVAAGVITFAVSYSIFQGFRSWHYALFTSAPYAVAVFAAAFYLSRDRNRGDAAGPAPERRRYLRPVRSAARRWASWNPMVQAALLAGLGMAVFIGIRQGLWPSDRSAGFGRHLLDSLVAGVSDGVEIGLILVFTRVIAGVPRPPRDIWAISRRPADQPETRTFLRAVGLGLLFAVIWGVGGLLKQGAWPTSIPWEPFLVVLITGVDFALGAWLFRWSNTWSRSAWRANPRSAARADLVRAVLCPLILAFTFGFAFGVTPPFNFNGTDVWAWFVVGLMLGSLGNEWPLYVAALAALRGRRGNPLPIRLIRFLDCCASRGILQPVGQAYQVQDDGLLQRLTQVPRALRGSGAGAPRM